MARLYAVAPPPKAPGPEYLEGLRAAACAALEYLVDAVELGEERSPPPPAEVLVQARQAARCDVSLDTVLRRCFAGYTLFGDFLMQEAEGSEELNSAAIKSLLRSQAALFDRLVAAVTDEYTREAETRRHSTAERRTERIERLLAGELLDTSELAYDFDAHHLGVIAKGPGAAAALREIASALDRRVLLVGREESTVWGWLGGREAIDLAALQKLIASVLPLQTFLVLGEPAEGLEGWRLSHRQAKAALSIAVREKKPVVRYSDVALLASIVQDDLLVTSLRRLYLVPIESERDGGEVLRQTLRAYFAAERNVSSAAHALQISRQTVESRLKKIERLLGNPISKDAVSVQLALQL